MLNEAGYMNAGFFKNKVLMFAETNFEAELDISANIESEDELDKIKLEGESDSISTR